ncbi:MAG: aa3-type cytochrome c oxidase subunit IV [Sneathiella sp.]
MFEPGSMNIEAQKESYAGFVKLFTVCTIGLVILLAVMAATLL